MRGTIRIADKTKKLDVDSRLSLKYYYRVANNLLKQAQIYQDEENWIDYYILLLRYSSLVSETIPDHRDFRLYPRERKENTKRLLNVITELEKLKPEVERQVDEYNNALLKSTSASSKSSPSSYSSALQLDSGAARPFNRNNQPLAGVSTYEKFGDQGNRDHVPGYSDSGSGYNSASSSRMSTYLDDQFNALSLNIPRPKSETLSRHSILGPVTHRPRREVVPVKVQYPSNVVGTPIELPSFIQDWNISTPAPGSSTNGISSANLAVSSAAASLDSLSDPASRSSFATDVAPPFTVIRQPLPPPIAAPVQTLQAGLDMHDHSQTHLPHSVVSDPRHRTSQALDGDLSKGPKHLHISTKMMDEFLRLAKANTARNLETCGVLSGSLKKGRVLCFYPDRTEARSYIRLRVAISQCQTLNEEEIFDSQDKRGLFQLGWIHTHPSQTCFMSSVDLHTHYAYQIMLPEAIAIVMAPTDVRPFGIFRLADPGGVQVIQQCQERGFHPHDNPPDGGPIYEHCNHVYMNPKLQFDVIDLRAVS